jgi:hypothetical protein
MPLCGKETQEGLLELAAINMGQYSDRGARGKTDISRLSPLIALTKNYRT